MPLGKEESRFFTIFSLWLPDQITGWAEDGKGWESRQ